MGRYKQAMNPYREPGEIEVPRPLEIPLKLSLFVTGDKAAIAMKLPLQKIAEEVEEHLQDYFVEDENYVNSRQVLAVEVKAPENA